jgi:hypothetical protein
MQDKYKCSYNLHFMNFNKNKCTKFEFLAGSTQVKPSRAVRRVTVDPAAARAGYIPRTNVTTKLFQVLYK